MGGWTQEYAGLTFVSVRGAGHEVPLHKPKLALALIKAFLSGNSMPSLELVSASWSPYCLFQESEGKITFPCVYCRVVVIYPVNVVSECTISPGTTNFTTIELVHYDLYTTKTVSTIELFVYNKSGVNKGVCCLLVLARSQSWSCHHVKTSLADYIFFPITILLYKLSLF